MFLPPKESSYLDAEIDRAYRDLGDQKIGSEEYQKSLDVVSKLHKLKLEERATGVSTDTMLTVGANILGILLIIRHEHVNVITSRAMGVLQRLK